MERAESLATEPRRYGVVSCFFTQSALQASVILAGSEALFMNASFICR
jgi:hypothetical protein